MNPRSIAEIVRRDVPVLRDDALLGEAVAQLTASRLPALPVVDSGGRYAGIFGEREFIAALFPGYVQDLAYAGFIPKSIEAAFQKRAGCETEPVSRHMNTEHVNVPVEFADIQLAETFLHHRVSIVPITENGAVRGVVTRSDFCRALAERFLAD